MEVNPDRRRISLSMKAAAEELGIEIEIDETVQAEPRQPRKKDRKDEESEVAAE